MYSWRDVSRDFCIIKTCMESISQPRRAGDHAEGTNVSDLNQHQYPGRFQEHANDNRGCLSSTTQECMPLIDDLFMIMWFKSHAEQIEVWLYTPIFDSVTINLHHLLFILFH